MLIKRCGGKFLGEWDVLYLDGSGGYIAVEVDKTHQSVHLEWVHFTVYKLHHENFQILLQLAS